VALELCRTLSLLVLAEPGQLLVTRLCPAERVGGEVDRAARLGGGYVSGEVGELRGKRALHKRGLGLRLAELVALAIKGGLNVDALAEELLALGAIMGFWVVLLANVNQI
jgi:hypothetical protein